MSATLTVYIAGFSARLTGDSEGKSIAGHMWYEIDDGVGNKEAFGFSPVVSHTPVGQGHVSYTDTDTYLDVSYKKTVEITAEQYLLLLDFGTNPESYGFDLGYKVFTNSCVHFVWKALSVAGLNPQGFMGDPVPTNNIFYLRGLRPQEGTGESIALPLDDRSGLAYLYRPNIIESPSAVSDPGVLVASALSSRAGMLGFAQTAVDQRVESASRLLIASGSDNRASFNVLTETSPTDSVSYLGQLGQQEGLSGSRTLPLDDRSGLAYLYQPGNIEPLIAVSAPGVLGTMASPALPSHAGMVEFAQMSSDQLVESASHPLVASGSDNRAFFNALTSFADKEFRI